MWLRLWEVMSGYVAAIVGGDRSGEMAVIVSGHQWSCGCCSGRIGVVNWLWL
jgi:hypothetical protein